MSHLTVSAPSLPLSDLVLLACADSSIMYNRATKDFYMCIDDSGVYIDNSMPSEIVLPQQMVVPDYI
jgi:hypothetical protein